MAFRGWIAGTSLFIHDTKPAYEVIQIYEATPIANDNKTWNTTCPGTLQKDGRGIIEINRVGGLWTDTLLVIQAATQFWVSREILEAKSSVFKDMLNIRLPDDGPTYDGCPSQTRPLTRHIS
ncbi:hypothetical protein DFH09DRAFT_1111830 [Mycena vulgaris]|nr:hypothetical protein DFH09DRAFT_1111830 [Mycena vulgaris]